MTTSTTTGLGAAASLNSTGNGTLGLAPEPPTQELGEEQFLHLLVTQLQAQDPLNPQDPQEFVAQLAQFSQVEQLRAANAQLEGVLTGMLALSNLQAVGLLGHPVVAATDTLALDGEGETSIGFHSAGEGEATVQVTDASGKVVFTQTVDAAEGLNHVSWDGRDADGRLCAAGEYDVSVTVTGEDGSEIAATAVVEGDVDSLSYETGQAMLVIGGVEVSLSDVISVSGIPAAEPTGTADDPPEEGGEDDGGGTGPTGGAEEPGAGTAGKAGFSPQGAAARFREGEWKVLQDPEALLGRFGGVL